MERERERKRERYREMHAINKKGSEGEGPRENH